MKTVFYAELLAEAFYVRDLLRQHGIMAEVGNETISQIRGEPLDLSTKPSVWIADESRVAEAEEIISNRKPHAVEEEWTCASCGNPNPGTFTACWSCQTEREAG